MPNKELTPSLEDYLEVILKLTKENNVARVKDIAEKINVKFSSVTGALKQLSKLGLVNYQPYQYITLTEKGKNEAKKIERKRKILRNFFTKFFGMKYTEAEETACKVEHFLENEIIDKFEKLNEFIEKCPRTDKLWLEKLKCYLNGKKEDEKCFECIEKLYKDYKNKPQITLKDLKPGEKGKIIKFVKKDQLVKRLTDLGATSNEIITVKKIAPLGDPIDVEIRGFHISIRKKDAENIIVEKVK